MANRSVCFQVEARAPGCSGPWFPGDVLHDDEIGAQELPAGNGKHPIVLVAISANDLAASTAFYTRLFGWHALPVAPDLTTATAPAGPAIALRANTPDGFPGVVPFIATD